MTSTPEQPKIVRSLVGLGEPCTYTPTADEYRATAYEVVQGLETTSLPVDHLEGITYALLAISADLAAIRAHLVKQDNPC